MGGEGLDFIRNVNRLTFHNRIAQCFVGMGINKFWRFSLTRSNRRKPARKNSLQIDSRDSTIFFHRYLPVIFFLNSATANQERSSKFLEFHDILYFSTNTNAKALFSFLYFDDP